MIQSVTIGGTINLGNYESLRLDVSADSPEEAFSALRRCLNNCALAGSLEHGLIDHWISRTLGNDGELTSLQMTMAEVV